jgi:serine/threonine protein kinase
MAVPCLDEDVLTDLAAGRLRLDAPGVEEHLESCPTCVRLLSLATATAGSPEASAGAPSAEAHPPGRPAGLAAGTVLKGTYHVLRLIGVGGMGEVYEVRHVRLAGRYAVKVLRPEVSRDQALLNRFLREAEITSSLHHPNIVQVIDFDHTPDGSVFLAMEYLAGQDLACLLDREGVLPLSRVQALVAQMAAGLAAAHKRGIIHRDLKPANVFVVSEDDDRADRPGGLVATDREERIKIMDFGLSKWSGTLLDTTVGLSRDHALIGTPRYMAPEQARGRNRELGAAADQFALGAIVYEMLAGRAPFDGDTVAEVLHAIAFDSPLDLRTHRPDLPVAVHDVVHRALAKRPEDRFPSVQAFSRAFDSASSGGPVDAPVTPTAVATGRSTGRRSPSIWIGGIAAVAAAAAVILAMLLWRGAGATGRTAGVGPAVESPSRQQVAAPSPAHPTSAMESPRPRDGAQPLVDVRPVALPPPERPPARSTRAHRPRGRASPTATAAPAELAPAPARPETDSRTPPPDAGTSRRRILDLVEDL